MFYIDGVDFGEKGFKMYWFIYGKLFIDFRCINNCYLVKKYFFINFFFGNSGINK